LSNNIYVFLKAEEMSRNLDCK